MLLAMKVFVAELFICVGIVTAAVAIVVCVVVLIAVIAGVT